MVQWVMSEITTHNQKGRIEFMANEEKIAALIAALASEGIQFGDVLKGLKDAKDKGIIKAKGRGKVPEDSPLRNAVIAAISGLHLNYKDGDNTVNGDLLAVISDNTKDATSFMVTLNDNWKVNFVKNLPKEKKDKQEKKETGPATFDEPTVS